MITIDKTEFINRLTQLCVKSAVHGLPKRRRDRHILLKSVTLLFDPERTYAESDVNNTIRLWLTSVAVRLDTDHAAIRRALVDERYFARDRAGSAYVRREPKSATLSFDRSVESVDVVSTIVEAMKVIERKRREHAPKLTSG
ncbi:DUF2087 domain-containing protein [Candidatus Eisenbacteria bacterium]|uniref:DUF2087 domain-containing protein n=1 Tax=Eiseniibacteriota bacterium TaxID=2212470 RepID=A0ABV6YI72_UNCEI